MALIKLLCQLKKKMIIIIMTITIKAELVIALIKNNGKEYCLN